MSGIWEPWLLLNHQILEQLFEKKNCNYYWFLSEKQIHGTYKSSHPASPGVKSVNIERTSWNTRLLLLFVTPSSFHKHWAARQLPAWPTWQVFLCFSRGMNGFLSPPRITIQFLKMWFTVWELGLVCQGWLRITSEFISLSKLIQKLFLTSEVAFLFSIWDLLGD